MTYRRKPVFVFSIILNVFLYGALAVYYFVKPSDFFIVWQYPYVYIFTGLSIILPLLYASSRKLILDDSMLINFQLWGALKEKYPWPLFEEGRYIRNSYSHSSHSGDNIDLIRMVMAKAIPATIRLYFKNGNEPLAFNVKTVSKCINFHEELKKYIKFSR
jgi:hypothetical protein